VRVVAVGRTSCKRVSLLGLHKGVVKGSELYDLFPLRVSMAQSPIIKEKIDALVYELYGLTAAEIKIVEGN
jgi:hypothetical protein